MTASSPFGFGAGGYQEEIISPPLPDPIQLSPEQAEQLRDDAQPKAGKYYTRLQGLYGTIGLGLYMFDPVCGGAVLASADETARSVDRLARENPSIRRVVEAMLTGSAYGQLLAAHLPILKAIADHHMPERFRFQGLPWATPEAFSGDGASAS